MEAILYVAHGTRMKNGEETSIQFIRKIQKIMPNVMQEIAFIEISTPTIPQGLEKCIKAGATRITLIPMLLFSAQHNKKDIPFLVSTIEEKFPFVEIIIKQAIGIQKLLIETVCQQIESMNDIDANQYVLVGRGSSDPSIELQFSEIANRVKFRTSIRNIDVAFLYGNGPSLANVLDQDRDEKVVLLPYLLFPGLLSKNLEKLVSRTDHLSISPLLGEFDTTLIAFKENSLRNYLITKNEEAAV